MAKAQAVGIGKVEKKPKGKKEKPKVKQLSETLTRVDA